MNRNHRAANWPPCISLKVSCSNLLPHLIWQFHLLPQLRMHLSNLIRHPLRNFPDRKMRIGNGAELAESISLARTKKGRNESVEYKLHSRSLQINESNSFMQMRCYQTTSVPFFPADTGQTLMIVRQSIINTHVGTVTQTFRAYHAKVQYRRHSTQIPPGRPCHPRLHRPPCTGACPRANLCCN
jgi:hypothetical protein